MKKEEEGSQTFQDLSDSLLYEGAFSLELTHDTDMIVGIEGTCLKGKVISVYWGRVKQIMDFVELYFSGQFFCLERSQIRDVRDYNGNLLF